MSDKLRDALIAHERLCYDMTLALGKSPEDVNGAAGKVLDSRNALLALAATADAPPEPTRPLLDAIHRLLQYSRTVEDTSGGRGEARCMFCYEPFAHCAEDCPWFRLQVEFDRFRAALTAQKEGK